MERVMKFRVWDDILKYYCDIQESASFDKDGSVNIRDGVILEQFIGYGYKGDYAHKHQNKVELYEGDIVEAWSQGAKRIFQLKYRNIGNPEYILYPAYQEGRFWSMSFTEVNGVMFDDLKLIGNIHATPELIPQSH